MCEGVSVLRSLGASLWNDPVIHQPHQLKWCDQVTDPVAANSILLNFNKRLSYSAEKYVERLFVLNALKKF